MKEKPYSKKNSWIKGIKKFRGKGKKGLGLRRVGKWKNRHNNMRKRCDDSKNRVYKKVKAEKLKGQYNENLLIGHCLIGCCVTSIGKYIYEKTRWF
jgi:hypothetical protein